MCDIHMSGQLCHVSQQSVRHGHVRFNASLVRPGNVCVIGQRMSVMVLCFSTFHLYPRSFKSCRSTKCPSRSCVFNTQLYACPFKPGRSTNCPSETCLFQPSFLPDILECIHGGVYLGYAVLEINVSPLANGR